MDNLKSKLTPTLPLTGDKAINKIPEAGFPLYFSIEPAAALFLHGYGS